MGAVAIALLLPLAIALVLVPFLGADPVKFVAFLYIFKAVSLIPVGNPFEGSVDYDTILQRASLTGDCYHVAVSLEPTAQPQPFAIGSGDYDWQPDMDSPPEDEPSGPEAWLETPLSKEQSDKVSLRMSACNLSDDVMKRAETAMAAPGSWIAFGTPGWETTLIYSKPQNLALIFSSFID